MPCTAWPLAFGCSIRLHSSPTLLMHPRSMQAHDHVCRVVQAHNYAHRLQRLRAQAGGWQLNSGQAPRGKPHSDASHAAKDRTRAGNWCQVCG